MILPSVVNSLCSRWADAIVLKPSTLLRLHRALERISETCFAVTLSSAPTGLATDNKGYLTTLNAEPAKPAEEKEPQITKGTKGVQLSSSFVFFVSVERLGVFYVALSRPDAVLDGR